MRKLRWKPALAWLLAAFFVIGGLGNIFVTEAIRSDYLRWGYPDWFHYVTGLLELIAATLIAIYPTRFFGALIAAAIMAAAAGTVLVNGEYAHAIAPLVVLLVAIIVSVHNRSTVR